MPQFNEIYLSVNLKLLEVANWNNKTEWSSQNGVLIQFIELNEMKVIYEVGTSGRGKQQ
jgi:hypothetical protein